MRIGVDMDGVLADFDKGWIDRWNQDHGTEFEYKNCDHWDALTSLTNVSYDEWWEWAQSKHEDLFLNLDPLPGAVEGVQRLKKAEHDIVIITAKPRWAAGHPSAWLIEHDVPYDEIHVTSNKEYVLVDVLIDDALHNIEGVYTYASLLNIDVPLLLQHRPWPYVNRGVDSNFADYITTSWEQITKIILGE